MADLFIGGLDIQRLYRRLLFTYARLGSVLAELGIDVAADRARPQLLREAHLQQCELCDYWYENPVEGDRCPDCEQWIDDEEE